MIVIKSNEEFSNFVAYFNSYKGKVYFDTETTGLDPHTCELLFLQFYMDTSVYIIDCFSGNIPKQRLHELKEGFHNKELIVIHNATFDYKQVYHHLDVEMGKLWDTMISEQLLQAGILEKGFGLDALAMRRLGVLLDKTVRDTFIGGPSSINDEMYHYAEKDVLVLKDIYEQQRREIVAVNLDRVHDLEMKVVPATAAMEYHGILIDQKLLDESIPVAEAMTKKVYRTMQADIVKAGLATEIMFDARGYTAINIASNPQMLSVLKRMGINVESLSKKELSDWDARWSRDHIYDEVEEEDDDFNIGFSHPFLKKLAVHKAISKLHSTYMIGLKNKINPKTGRLHPSFNQCGAGRTGRYSSSNINFQNLPNRDKFNALGLGEYNTRFLCIAPPGRKFIISDYSQVELIILAALSKDENLLNQITKGDVHTYVANNLFGVEITKDNKETEPFKTFRFCGKTLSYGTVYGSTGWNMYRTLANRLAAVGHIVSQADGDRWVDTWRNKLFPTTGAFLQRMGNQAVKLRYTTSVLGRRRQWKPFETKGQELAAIREGSNQVIQSSSADMTKLAILYCYERLDRKRANLVATIHDEILTECDDDYLDEACETVKTAMEDAGSYLFPELERGIITASPKTSVRYDK